MVWASVLLSQGERMQQIWTDADKLLLSSRGASFPGGGRVRLQPANSGGNKVYLNKPTPNLDTLTNVSLSRPKFQGDINVPPPGLRLWPAGPSILSCHELNSVRRLHLWDPGELKEKLDNLLPLIKCLLQEGLNLFPHVRGKRGRYSVSDRGSRNSGRGGSWLPWERKWRRWGGGDQGGRGGFTLKGDVDMMS